MSVSNMVWCIFGGVFGALLGASVTMGVLCNRLYTEPDDYYELDDFEVKTPSYEEMKEFEDYDTEFDSWP